MRALSVFSILAVIGALGYAFWHDMYVNRPPEGFPVVQLQNGTHMHAELDCGWPGISVAYPDGTGNYTSFDEMDARTRKAVTKQCGEYWW